MAAAAAAAKQVADAAAAEIAAAAAAAAPAAVAPIPQTPEAGVNAAERSQKGSWRKSAAVTAISSSAAPSGSSAMSWSTIARKGGKV